MVPTRGQFMKSKLKYFAISTLISIFSLTVIFMLFDLYIPLGDFFGGVPFRNINFWSAIHLEPKLPYIIGIGIALNYKKLKRKKNCDTVDLYRG
ncbi:hypothetical protein BC643_3080 [Mangrovibacterium diazotrophicum]|uniref:Uncharacterized protein n=2 Tax=Mangrovibacterium diazotrophicum TaxID=1261403 RepID=A0A419WB74_9BACT|nr:hypothetical protein BC643_3080 [Mangrovibacterium diazotrophicum]